jgi:hypothetical protein
MLTERYDWTQPQNSDRSEAVPATKVLGNNPEIRQSPGKCNPYSQTMDE